MEARNHTQQQGSNKRTNNTQTTPKRGFRAIMNNTTKQILGMFNDFTPKVRVTHRELYERTA